jgi:hypothetical protein
MPLIQARFVTSLMTEKAKPRNRNLFLETEAVTVSFPPAKIPAGGPVPRSSPGWPVNLEVIPPLVGD